MKTTPKKKRGKKKVVAVRDENGSGTGGSSGGKGQSYKTVAGGSAWKNAPGSK